MNGFESYLVTYSILGFLLGYYVVYIGKRLDNIRIRIRESQLTLDDKNSKNLVFLLTNHSNALRFREG